MKEKLTRSRSNRVLGGVSAGLGEYFDIDPLIVRILFVVSIFFSGIGILLYLIMWVVVPEEPFITPTFDESSNSDTSGNNINIEDPLLTENTSNHRRIMLGVILLVAGIFFLSIKFLSFIDFEDFFPVLLVGIGVYIIFKSKKEDKIK